MRAASLFPMTGALFNVGLALVVFLAQETISSRVQRWPWLSWVLGRELKLDAHYRANPPRPFLYYVSYPLLCPYWLIDAKARREFLLFKGYTLTSVLVLLVSVVVQYFVYWQPELGIKAYLPVVGITLAIELVFVLALLMPIATTIISLHQSLRRKRLWVLLVVGLASTTWALARVLHRRDPIVSYATRERVLLRTKSNPATSRERPSSMRCAPGGDTGERFPTRSKATAKYKARFSTPRTKRSRSFTSTTRRSLSISAGVTAARSADAGARLRGTTATGSHLAGSYQGRR